MDFIIDNPETEKHFQEILKQIKLSQNGVIAGSMNEKGLCYEHNWGVAITGLKKIAGEYPASHLLALKLWNKKWRETMIMAALIDEPAKVSEEQMDFWTKSFVNTEIAEQFSANLWAQTKFAYIKALEWCRGKKHLVRFTGLHLMGRLALTDKKSPDEMFEPFFEELPPLAKDPSLFHVFYRSFSLLGSRSIELNKLAVGFAEKLKQGESENEKELGQMLANELTGTFVREKLKINNN